MDDRSLPPTFRRSFIGRVSLAAAAGALVALAGLGGGGCQSRGSLPRGATGDPIIDMDNNTLSAEFRDEAVRTAWQNSGGPSGTETPASGETLNRKATRESLKELVWKGGAPERVRLTALESLLSDTTPEGAADTRNMIRLRLPTESNWAMVTRMSKAVGEGAASGEEGWQSCTSGLVRSWSRKVREPADDQRPEKHALEQLYPQRPAFQTVFAVFLAPQANGSGEGDFAVRARENAWDLLGRLDPDGAMRAPLLASAPVGDDDEVIGPLRTAATQLHVVPVTGSELTWLKALMAKPQWWAQTQSAIATLPAQATDASARGGIQMRHLESIRWASQNHPEWLNASREALLSELESRLSTRKIRPRTENVDDEWGLRNETLAEWREQISWGDALTILAIDEIIHDPSIIKTLFDQVAEDRTDTTTEYGGVFFVAGEGEAARAVLYPPRPVQRMGDSRFIASETMFSQSDTSLAHYHFHVQKERNGEYAGPGDGDMEYAATHGRACIVFTSLDADTLGADYYQRNGVRLDLGEIKR